MRNYRVLTSGIFGLALLVASAALPQEKVSCRIPPFRGATSPGGATVDTTVVNNGQPCRIRVLSDPDAQIPTTALSAVEEPQHGKLEFPGPDVALYTPSPGYTGPDRYVIAGRGPTARGKTAAVRVSVRVTVVSP